jgi:hypothetical protein
MNAESLSMCKGVLACLEKQLLNLENLMKTIKGVLSRSLFITALAVLALNVAYAQSGNPHQITGAKVTADGAIQLSWQSETNTVYRVEYTDALVDISLGGPVWSTLYDDYPSHGTNTFWLDTGYYTPVPPIPHPKYAPQRFYRIAVEGTNTAPSAPTVAIVSPSNGTTARGLLTVTVSASSDQPVLQTLLYVDGQEMPSSDDGTNYVINTCEWPNGAHVIFAVAKSQSGFAGLMNDFSITYGRAVSSYVNVTFDNLISQYSFSQQFFEPSLGQTQQVSATFAANVNWTLEIQDVNTNDVLFVTGSGGSMQYNWDGTGTNGITIPDGVYTYLLTVQTNGLPLPQGFFGDGDTNLPPPLSMSSSVLSSDSTDSGWYPTSPRQAVAAGWNYYYAQPPPMPPVLTNGVWANWEDIYGPEPLTMMNVPMSSQGMQSPALSSTSTDSASPLYGGPSSESTRGPSRPPAVPIKGSVGTFGIAYQTYQPYGISSRPPPTGWPAPPLHVYVAIDGLSENATVYAMPIPPHKDCADGFSLTMQKGGWKPVFNYPNRGLTARDLKKASLGGNSIFNQANIGLLMMHGSYATTVEKDNIKYTYIDVDNGSGSLDYVRLSDMDFGSSGVMGLRWMTIAACNLFYPADMQSMGAARFPGNDNLHLLCGASTIYYANQIVGKYYAQNMLANQTIPNAWINASRKAYASTTSPTIPDPINVRIYGWLDCFNDTLTTYYDPDTGDGLRYRDVNVYTPQ